MRMAGRKPLTIAGLSAFLLATIPMFFEIYRGAAFNTLPRDDYAPYLLALAGQGGEIPVAPYAYRVLSIAAAIPFYFLLPAYTFTNLPAADPAWLKATQALSFVSYVSIVMTAWTIYRIARQRLKADRASSVIAGLLSFLLSNFVTKAGIDPIAILVISLLVLHVGNPVVFGALVVTSILVNEKIPILFATILTFRALWARAQRGRFTLYPQLGAAWGSVIGYFAMIGLLRIPGNEKQTTPALLLDNVQSSFVYSLSIKGLVLNALPVLLVTVLAILAVRSRSRAVEVADVSGVIVLLILAVVADVQFNMGRIVMYSYPLYLPALARVLDDAWNGHDTSPQTGEA